MDQKVPNYIPPFLWQFWNAGMCVISSSSQLSLTHFYRGKNSETQTVLPQPLHVFDIYSSSLTECRQATLVARPIFADFAELCVYLYPGAWMALQVAEQAFATLQSSVEPILTHIINAANGATISCTTASIPLSASQIMSLTRFFVFLRFRNSRQYRDIVHELQKDSVLEVRSGDNSTANSYITAFPGGRNFSKIMKEIYIPLVRQVRSRHVLAAFAKFLDDHAPLPSNPEDSSSDWEPLRDELPCPPDVKDPFREVLNTYLWEFCDEAELCLGVAAEDQEFILPDNCFGILDEGFGYGLDSRRG
jgi:hypothetical protein